MGLDMYLTAELYVSGYSHNQSGRKNQYAGLVKLAGALMKDLDSETPSGEIKLTVGYWRKANAIHAWFVKNVQAGVDDCGDYSVSRDKLTELMNLCSAVIKDRKLAKQLLPTKSGFFFGSTDIGEGYIQDLTETVKIISRVLGSPRLGGFSFSYHSSW